MKLQKRVKELPISPSRYKDAMDEVSVMMNLSGNEIPEIAIEHLKWLCSKSGFCGEVMVTAFAAYCQAILKLPCKDPLYQISDEGRKWFEENKDKYKNE